MGVKATPAVYPRQDFPGMEASKTNQIAQGNSRTHVLFAELIFCSCRAQEQIAQVGRVVFLSVKWESKLLPPFTQGRIFLGCKQARPTKLHRVIAVHIDCLLSKSC